MGLFEFFKRLFFGSPAPDVTSSAGSASAPHSSPTPAAPAKSTPRRRRKRVPGQSSRPPVQLRSLRYRSTLVQTPRQQEQVPTKPYAFAVRDFDAYLDLSQDADPRWLEYYGLPALRTPQDLANWLGIPVGRLAWLTQQHLPDRRPASPKEAHYHYQWKQKRSGGYRLIEAPKELLKTVQTQILREILDRVPPHPAAHGFVEGRSIVTNARPHLGQRFILKFDLENFYPSVRYSRVVGIFRSLGFSREVAIWLARLTTTAVPQEFRSPDSRPGWHWSMSTYRSHHLPQGAPTSPALANLSAYALDVRLSGLAKAYHVTYTRYADDLTFSGAPRTVPALGEVIQLTEKIVRSERFRLHPRKRKVLRNNQRQVVTGVVVNDRLNISRKEFDQLKATLHNCIKLGPASQNRAEHPEFAAHLRGRIAHVRQLNALRGDKLMALFQRIDWNR